MTFIQARLPRLLFGALLLAGLSAAAQAQSFPNKPLRIIPMGTGFPENTTRMIAAEIQEMIKQSIIVEPKAGANGILAAEYVAKQPADGYTILVGTNSTHAANQSLYKKLPYDYVKDFVPISGVSQGYLLAAVNAANVPAKTVGEFTAMAKKNPGKLTFGWGGSSPRAAAELYKLQSGINLQSVPYKSNPQATIDLVGGRLDIMISDFSTLLPHVKSGALRALAVSGKTRLASMPDLPTMQEAGVPDYDMTFWLAAYAPANTPKDVVQRLNELFVAALKRPKVVEYLTNTGSVPFPMSSDELMKFQVAEYGKWKKIIVAAGIEPE
jgi:tripartite-type tricarboxylate transporter receptor subunit TctC